MSSSKVSMIRANAPPALSTFLAMVTNEQSPLSTMKIGLTMLSGSPERSEAKPEPIVQPLGFDSLKYTLPP